jgi:hypothetical protein
MNDKEQRKELKRWLFNTEWNNPIALSLTFKQRFNNISLDIIKASSAVGNFLTRIQKGLLGQNYKRNNIEPLQVVSTLETKGRIHAHLAIDLPLKTTFAEIEKLTNYHWNGRRIPFSYYENKITPVENAGGWMSYITKFKDDNDTLDLPNTFLRTLHPRKSSIII